MKRCGGRGRDPHTEDQLRSLCIPLGERLVAGAGGKGSDQGCERKRGLQGLCLSAGVLQPAMRRCGTWKAQDTWSSSTWRRDWAAGCLDLGSMEKPGLGTDTDGLEAQAG